MSKTVIVKKRGDGSRTVIKKYDPLEFPPRGARQERPRETGAALPLQGLVA